MIMIKKNDYQTVVSKYLYVLFIITFGQTLKKIQ